MTRERAKELFHVYTAWMEGKTILYKDHHGNWREVDHSLGFGMDPSWYKVVEDEGDGTIPQDEQWFIDMVNEPDSAPEEYYERSAVPEYIVASTSDMAGETYVFEADANGNILSYDEYGGLAERWGDHKWYDAEAAVKSCMSQTYMKVNRVNKGNHILFRLVDDKEIHQPNEFTYFDGDESDRISY